MKQGRVLIILLLILAACSSGKKAYEKGDYYASVLQAANRLRQKPDHEKSAEALRNSYPMAVAELEEQAKNEIASNTPYKWKNAIQSYDQINRLYEEMKRCPGCLRVIKNPVNYYSEIAPLKEKAAEESYNAGINNLMKGNRIEAKKAYFNFIDAQNYAPGYKDVVEYLSKSKDVATLKVIVEQIPVPARYNLSGGFFQDKVEEFLHNQYPDQGFIKFFTPQEANSVSLQNADQILRMQFDDFSVGNSALKEKEETFTRDSVKIGETKVAGKSSPVYGTVKAKLITSRKEIISRGLLSMIAVDAKTNGILATRKFTGEYIWVSQWARFNGDERALNDKQLALCNLREQQPPQQQDLFLEFTKPIYNQLIPSIKSFYQNY